MTKPETLIDYGRRVARVADHIADHLDDELDVERLASVAHFSPWHFHRIYRETTGETVAPTSSVARSAYSVAWRMPRITL